MTDDGINRIVGQLGTQVVELRDGTTRVNLAIDGGILAITLRVLRVEVDSLIVKQGCAAAVLSQSLKVTLQNVGRSILLVSFQCHVGILGSIGCVFCFIECTTEGNEILGILLVLLVEGFQLVCQVCGFATNNFLNGIDVGLSAVLCHSAGAETCQHGAHYKIFDCFHTLSLF